MALPFEVPPDSNYRLLYRGPVGVSGVDVQQSWDLSVLPQYLRERPTFVDDFRVFVRQVGSGVTAVSSDVEFTEVDGVFTELVLTLTAADEADELAIEAWFIASAVR